MDKDIRDVQKYKANYISKAQDKKEESIAFFNSVNSAVNLLSKINMKNKEDLKEEIIYWRDWFYEEWVKRNNVIEEEEKKEILNEEI